MGRVNVTSSGTVVVGKADRLYLDIPGGGDVTIRAPAGPDSVDKFTIDFHDHDSRSDTVRIDLGTFARNGLRIDLFNYDPSDRMILEGAFDTFVPTGNLDEYRFSYIGEDGGTYSGYLQLKDAKEKDFTDPFKPITIICFADGTLIETAEGPRPVETLRAGNLVRTRDHGLQPLRWTGRRVLDSLDLARMPHLLPVTIRADAFGPGRPATDLTVSPNHQILLDDWRAELLFGVEEVLVAAKHLIDDCRVLRQSRASHVAYNHLLFDRHEIVFSNGLETESLHLGPMALDALSPEAAAEVAELFPDFDAMTGAAGVAARRSGLAMGRVLQRHEGNVIARYLR